MTAATHRRKTAWRAIVRGVAVVFLVFAFADLAFPALCAEDNEPMFRSQLAGGVTDSDAPEPSEHVPLPAEDCFCCCSHIISEAANSPLAALNAVSDSARQNVDGLPLAPVQLLFHPPRLA